MGVELSSQTRKFVEESQKMRGLPFAEGTLPADRLLQICLIIETAHRFVDPYLVNGMLSCRHDRHESLLREGTDTMESGRIPPATRVAELLDEWTLDAEAGIKRLKRGKKSDTRKREIETFAWEMHDRLICIKPFQVANERTARIMLNHIRLLLGLDVLVIKAKDARKYRRRINRYRREVFRPRYMRKEKRSSK